MPLEVKNLCNKFCIRKEDETCVWRRWTELDKATRSADMWIKRRDRSRAILADELRHYSKKEVVVEPTAEILPGDLDTLLYGIESSTSGQAHRSEDSMSSLYNQGL